MVHGVLLCCSTSLQFGISALKKVNYDRVALDDRRRNSEEEVTDVLVWTNERLIKWVAAIGLKVSWTNERLIKWVAAIGRKVSWTNERLIKWVASIGLKVSLTNKRLIKWVAAIGLEVSWTNELLIKWVAAIGRKVSSNVGCCNLTNSR